MSRWRRGGSPDGLWAKPLLIGSVRDSEQVQEKALSSRLSAAPTSLFGFVLLCQLLPFDMHITHVLFMAFWRKISRDHLAVVCRHRKCSPRVCVDGVAISKQVLWRCLTLMQPKEMNDLCDCHAERWEQPRLYITHRSFSFSTACGVFRETAMLIEWLEKNTDETFLAQAGWGRRGEAELQGFTTHIPKGTRTIPVWPEQRLHLFILLKMWILIKIFSYYNHVTVYWISGPHRRGDHICEISTCVWLLQYIMQGNSEFAWLSDHQIERTLLFHAGFDL